MAPKRRPISDRLMENIMPIPFCGCWVWTGTLYLTGYGKIVVNGITSRAHRVSYELFKGAIGAGQLVCHRCNVRSCVNPDHLYVGTQTDNLRQASREGRLTSGNARKTHCLNGHPLSGENLQIDPKGFRCCRTCRQARSVAARTRRKNTQREAA